VIRLKSNRLTRYEKALASLLSSCGRDFHCEKIAGSGRRIRSICDCIVTYFRDAYYVEFKAVKYSIMRINGKVRRQLECLTEFCNENGYNPAVTCD